jgi:hypothetical protein
VAAVIASLSTTQSVWRSSRSLGGVSIGAPAGDGGQFAVQCGNRIQQSVWDTQQAHPARPVLCCNSRHLMPVVPVRRAVADCEGLPYRSITAQQGDDRVHQVRDINQGYARLRRAGHERNTALHQLEYRQHLLVAGAVHGGRAHDDTVDVAKLQQDLFACPFALRVPGNVWFPGDD